ncbi:MAG: histone deacetylase [Bacteroidota bacterium]
MNSTDKIPIIYTDSYNIGLLGIENLHPFDTKKYRKVYKHLHTQLGIQKSQLHTPELVRDEQLELVHSRTYLDSLRQSEVIASVAELGPLAMLPAGLLRRNMLRPMRYAVGGSILGAKLALQHGWAVNLSGGYHHAKAGNGEGFCFFADIPMAIHTLWQEEPDLQVLVVDLDAHQGNGIEAIMQNDDRFRMLDVYNDAIYPNDLAVKAYIDYHFPISPYTTDNDYLEIVQQALSWALTEKKPDLLIYNAGTDIYEHDPLGQLKVSEAGVIQRDRMVFEMALAKDTAILMVLSGGYTAESGPMIGKSLEGILKDLVT